MSEKIFTANGPDIIEDGSDRSRFNPETSGVGNEGEFYIPYSAEKMLKVGNSLSRIALADVEVAAGE